MSGIPDIHGLLTAMAALHDDLQPLLDHRGLLRRVAEECGTDYKRLHELVTEKSEPRHSLGRCLEDWIICASLLAATRSDLVSERKIPFVRLFRLLDLKERTTAPFLKMKIEGIVELIGPVAKRVSPSPQEAAEELQRECSHQNQAKRLIDSSISELTAEIEKLLR